MSAWTNLLAASSLARGNAWDLITHPRTGGTGTGVVVNTGAVALVDDTTLSVATESPINIKVVAPEYTVVISDTGVNAELDVA